MTRISETLWVSCDGTPLVSYWSYTTTRPYEVRVDFLNGDETVTWDLSRDLLSEGLHVRVGVGDVRVASSPGTVSVSLTGRHRDREVTATIGINRDDLVGFLRRTHRLVPAGQERVDVDAGLADILRRAA